MEDRFCDAPTEGAPDAAQEASAVDQLAQREIEWLVREERMLMELDQAFQRYENAVFENLPRSANEQLSGLLQGAGPSQHLTLGPGGDSTGAQAKGDVFWFAQGKQGFLRVEGLGNLDPGHWTFQAWVVDAARPEESPVSCGTFVAIPGLTTVVALKPMVLVQVPTQAWITVERRGGVVQSFLGRMALTSE